MKTVAALLAGLLLSTVTFVAGLGIALAFLDVAPEHKLDVNNTMALWSTSPVTVDTKTQVLERVAPRLRAMETKEVASLGDIETSAKAEIDRVAKPKVMRWMKSLITLPRVH